LSIYQKGVKKTTPRQKTQKGIRRAFLPHPPARRIPNPAVLKKEPRQSKSFSSRKNSFALPRPHRISPRHTARILGGQNTKKKNVLSILEKIGRAQIRKVRNFFLFGVAE